MLKGNKSYKTKLTRFQWMNDCRDKKELWTWEASMKELELFRVAERNKLKAVKSKASPDNSKNFEISLIDKLS